jgi:hypothetical protein
VPIDGAVHDLPKADDQALGKRCGAAVRRDPGETGH